MRRRNAKNAHSRVLNSKVIIQNPLDYKGKWNTLFGNNNPIYLEIGMGKGKFIIEHAKRNPNINYIGIEKFDGVIIQAADKLEKEPLPNLYLVSIDAFLLDAMFEHNEVAKIFLNFSDPWPKSRHDKRRLTHSNYLKLYNIVTNGEIEFKTDNRELFEFSLISLNENGWKFLELSLDLHKSKDDIITTEYEDKFSSLGNPIYYVKTIKESN